MGNIMTQSSLYRYISAYKSEETLQINHLYFPSSSLLITSFIARIKSKRFKESSCCPFSWQVFMMTLVLILINIFKLIKFSVFKRKRGCTKLDHKYQSNWHPHARQTTRFTVLGNCESQINGESLVTHETF